MNGDTLVSKTEKIGKATIELLNLNSKRLRTLRTIRREENKLEGEIAFGIFQLRKLLRNGKIKNNEIIKRMEALKEIKASLEDAIKQFSQEHCSSYEHEDDPGKKEYIKKRKAFLKTIF